MTNTTTAQKNADIYRISVIHKVSIKKACLIWHEMERWEWDIARCSK